MKKYLIYSILVGFLAISQVSLAADKPSKGNDVDFFATVNGTPLTNGLLDLNVKAALAQGQKDSPELKNALKDELINRELLTQESIRQGLDKDIDFRDQIAQLKQTLMIQAFLENHFQKNPISDAKLREEYDRQRKLIGEGASANQYRISQIIVSNETDALDLIRRIQKGELFGKLAQDYSIDQASKANGGQLGWVLPGQVVAPVANVIVNLSKGAVANAPIQTQGGWVIVKVDDKRPFKLPTFDEAKPQLRQAVIQQYLTETVKKLRESAKIVM
ncbi:peptidylprolyl isomerase [Polynucleobacter sp. AP-Melu-500A-A1]|uniref:peptidylprolyl isomerase n=1 Tax=Polynucleobacter sp. AP-Melu-500A-A1 TaxID=2576929 RepID=UPI001C0C1657|nr:peptidylprolyl isomerase [Polynucleobacter sp. AP-Melu-500A-A1]MBU3631674.1 peptidylprolyl isomerase [Polynucleobacter sp. AP-Melu-500A-A1]